jgi:hypothetical protein
MKTRLHWYFLVATLAVSTTPALANGMQFGRSQAPAPLEGTWQIVVAPYVCSTGAAIPNAQFRSRVTFVAGGTLLETTSNPSFQPGQRGPGMGAWERVGRESYRVVFEAYVLFTSTTTPPRYQRGEQRVEQYIEMDGTDAWTSTAGVFFRDDAGNSISSGCMRATGSRMRS